MPRSLRPLRRHRLLHWLAFASWMALALTPALPVPAWQSTAPAKTTMTSTMDCHPAATPDTGHAGHGQANCHCAAMTGSLLAVPATPLAVAALRPVGTRSAHAAPALPTPTILPLLRPPLA